MRSLGIVIRAVVVIIAIAFASSCVNKEAKRIMDTADAVMWTKPDSALAALESIDTLSLKTEVQRARYSLLYTMALSRNWIDTTDLRVIQPAAKYYERHGSKDDKMRMYYYLGTVHFNAGNLESAIENYVRAKEYSSDSDNMMFKGLISSAISDVYARNHNFYESITFSKAACDYFAQAGDSFRLWNTTACLANYYLNIEDWHEADSLNSIFFSQPIRDTSIYSRQLFNVAWGNYLRPDSNPCSSIDLFVKAISEYDGRPSFRDYCVYASASEAIGDHKTADDIIRQLEMAGMDSTVLSIWKYRIFKHRGDYKAALSFFEQSVRESDNEIRKTVSQSVALAQSDYYENKSLLLDRERHDQSLLKWILSLVCLLSLTLSVMVYLNRKMVWKRQVEEMSSINDEISQRLSESLMYNEANQRSVESLTLANEQAEKRIQVLSEKLTAVGREQMMVSLRSKYVQIHKRQYGQLNDLCHQYFDPGQSSRWAKDKIYAEVKRILSILEAPNQKALESMLDENLDGIMARFRAAMPDVNEKDIRLFSLLILGFDTKTISRIAGYSVNSIYTKRYNLKEKIMVSDSEDKELFLELISS